MRANDSNLTLERQGTAITKAEIDLCRTVENGTVTVGEPPDQVYDEVVSTVN